jgi:CO/xanthine dehydrogenase Mo-binding subunit
MTTTSAIGRSIRRVDGGEKVTGLTRFAADLALPGMVHARLVLSPHAHARILGIETKRAAALPGVLGVFTGRDLGIPKLDASSRNKSPLAVDRVVFTGHPVVAVVAETPAIAEDAAGLVEIEYDAQPAVLDSRDAMRKDAPRVRTKEGASGEEELAMHGAATGAQKLQ